ERGDRTTASPRVGRAHIGTSGCAVLTAQKPANRRGRTVVVTVDLCAHDGGRSSPRRSSEPKQDLVPSVVVEPVHQAAPMLMSVSSCRDGWARVVGPLAADRWSRLVAANALPRTARHEAVQGITVRRVAIATAQVKLTARHLFGPATPTVADS